MKIWFDERTQVYRDGQRMSVRDLGPEDHASVETILDGANVFAVSIHILSETAKGECEGRVLRYNPGPRRTCRCFPDVVPAPVIFQVPANTSIARVGEQEICNRSLGAIRSCNGVSRLSLVRSAGKLQRRNVARQIKVMAVPGAVFVFNGNISFLDIHTGTMVLIDPRDGKSYQIHFDSARLPASATLRPQANVTVTATYDGAGYAASAITAN